MVYRRQPLRTGNNIYFDKKLRMNIEYGVLYIQYHKVLNY